MYFNGGNQRCNPSGASSSNYKCWNCGSFNYKLDECDQPRDQAKIDEARAQFRAIKSRNQNPKYKKIDGKPMVRNKQGTYVLDQRKMQKKKKKAQLTTALLALQNGPATSTGTDVRSSTPLLVFIFGWISVRPNNLCHIL